MPLVLLRRLQHFAALSAEEARALALVIGTPATYPAGVNVLLQNEPTDGVNILLDGMAYRHKLLEDGRRQIFSYMIPGDVCDIKVDLLRRTDGFLTTFCESRIAFVSQGRFDALLAEYPRLAACFRWTEKVTAAIYEEWIVSLGQRTAFERLAHLICELLYRLRAVGGAGKDCIAFPITQNELGDTLGLSTVHVNRTLQELRRRKLIELSSRQLHVLDLPLLEVAGLFSPGYLHLDEAVLRTAPDTYLRSG